MRTEDAAVIVYRPWVPRSGMRRTFGDLSAAWGNPNDSARNEWPQAVLAVVCERGAPRPLLFDNECARAGQYYFLNHKRLVR